MTAGKKDPNAWRKLPWEKVTYVGGNKKTAKETINTVHECTNFFNLDKMFAKKRRDETYDSSQRNDTYVRVNVRNKSSN